MLGDAAASVDEDGDNILDRDDNCPGIYNPTQGDGDGDGVGDACDPHPNTPGDRIALADMFDGPTIAVTPDTPANWALAAGLLTTTGAPDATDAQVTLSEVARAPTFEVGFVVADYGTSPALNTVTVTVAFPGNTGTCAVMSASAGLPLGEVVTEVNVNDEHTSVLTTPIAPGANATVRATREAATTSDGTCTVAESATPFAAGPDADFSATTVGVTVQAMTVSLRYVVLYDVP